MELTAEQKLSRLRELQKADTGYLGMYHYVSNKWYDNRVQCLACGVDVSESTYEDGKLIHKDTCTNVAYWKAREEMRKIISGD